MPRVAALATDTIMAGRRPGAICEITHLETLEAGCQVGDFTETLQMTVPAIRCWPLTYGSAILDR